MEIWNVIRGLSAATLFLAASSASAATIQCDGCSAAQMETAASDYIYSHYNYLPSYVVNVPGGVVRKYSLFTDQTAETNPETDPINVWVAEMPVESDALTYVQNMREIANEIAAKSTFVGGTDTDEPSDAHEAMRRSDLEENMVSRMETYYGNAILQRIIDWTSWIDIPFFDANNVRIPVEIRYPDGSTSSYTYNPTTGRYERVPDSSRDASGNRIPETRTDFTDSLVEFNFGDLDGQNQIDDFNDMLERARLMGIPIYDGRGGGVGVVTVLQCSYTGCLILNR